MKYKILGIVILSLVAIQFIPYGKDHKNPPVVSEPEWNSPATRAMFYRVCANCHSNETKWPWYSRVAPVSWMIQHDVDEGREHMNLSLWGVQTKNHADEAAGEIREGEMPPMTYVLGHPEAKMTEQEKKDFIAGLVATFGEKKIDH
ncbi:MAG: heme-binding domain-containing protein [Proteobacteria bacterium]|nr:heme-binding domain-containing protein [Pseudomonadota bacterium]